ncbi:sarcosine oxidase subunit alpha family protein [Paraburkholderia sp. J63]|uniref:sarcosine oxidase subunit alpha family protein n=1 Tax=Paraburkholderia sp. J63 TaxID=2805434 RepID=UPI002ABE4886|nr:sarcosine oxidase subunit alpha family protein [Paraburkholderia sp. J63]
MKPLERVTPFGREDAGDPAQIPFTFDGKRYTGRAGDTLAAALLANGVDIVGRSFKLHRPRGVFAAGIDECNALVQLEAGGFDEPNARATLVELYPELRARGQNAWPNVRFDLFNVLDRFQRWLPASFYYKSMIWPNWHFYERFVRQIAGLGRAPEADDAQRYQRRNVHCDVLVCGAGPAGLAAALAAARAGLNVIVAEQGRTFGGALNDTRELLDGVPAIRWVESATATLRAMPRVRLLSDTTVSGYYENNFLVAVERVANAQGPAAGEGSLRERLWRIRAGEVVLATGALERPLVFADNDRPGVMLAGAVRSYLNRFGVVAGQRIVVVANHDDAYRTVFDFHAAGLRDIVMVDTRSNVPARLRAALSERGIALHAGYGIQRVRGKRRVRAVEIARHTGSGRLEGVSVTLACDLVAMSSGWTPTIHLFSQAGGSLRYDDTQFCLVPDQCAQAVQVAGAANGVFSLAACLREGDAAGRKAARRLGAKVDVSATAIAARLPHAEEEPAKLGIEPFWFTRTTRTDKQWLDFQYDVKVSDVALAMRENFQSVEHVKRYTTGGMSIDQGKSSNFNILAVMAELSGRPIVDVGTTRFRPPYAPVTLGTFAGPTVGERYAPWRTLPAHACHAAQQASFDDYGWRRPGCYLRDDEDIAAATTREVLAVRNGVGLFDGSPLGKIDVRGPDAAAFLNRVYVNNLATLKPGFARYAMLTNENGVLIDDGVIARISDTRFIVHATSGAVDRVFLLLDEYLQCEWPDLRVFVNNVTTQWANVTVSGPHARALVSSIDSDIDWDPQAFGHMQFRQGTFAGAPARVLRASFTGEATYEISVPARYAASLWETVQRAGAPLGATPYGIEALEVMRTEKGYLHIGADTDGASNPHDIGWERIIAKKQGDFIGRRSLQRPADLDARRLAFVGIEAIDAGEPLPVGGHFVEAGPLTPPTCSQGYVTAACLSPMLGKSIGLGILSNGAARIGETVQIYAKGKVCAARIVPPAHFDPQGERLHV